MRRISILPMYLLCSMTIIKPMDRQLEKLKKEKYDGIIVPIQNCIQQ